MPTRTVRDPAAAALLVVTTPDGWAVRRRHSARALRRFSDRTEAVTYASATGAREGLTVYVHRPDGMVDRVIRPTSGDVPSP